MADKNSKSVFALASFTWLACAALPAAATAAAVAAGNCADLAHIALPSTTITLAESVAAGGFTPPVPSWARAFMQPKPIPAAFCRVAGDIRPTQDSDIKFEVWLPLSNWSGRYESVGNGGFAGSIRYDSMLNPLLGGSVVASTDDGHDAPCVDHSAGGLVQFTAGGDSRTLRWSVHDTGRGISATEGMHLFDPFYCGRQAGPTNTTSGDLKEEISITWHERTNL